MDVGKLYEMNKVLYGLHKGHLPFSGNAEERDLFEMEAAEVGAGYEDEPYFKRQVEAFGKLMDAAIKGGPRLSEMKFKSGTWKDFERVANLAKMFWNTEIKMFGDDWWAFLVDCAKDVGNNGEAGGDYACTMALAVLEAFEDYDKLDKQVRIMG